MVVQALGCNFNLSQLIPEPCCHHRSTHHCQNITLLTLHSCQVRITEALFVSGPRQDGAPLKLTSRLRQKLRPACCFHACLLGPRHRSDALHAANLLRVQTTLLLPTVRAAAQAALLEYLISCNALTFDQDSLSLVKLKAAPVQLHES